ncbi:MAG TPA: PDZ domain-containing protein [Puia sp.]|nr:PDZ domain-containing protein [Puia sp.]
MKQYLLKISGLAAIILLLHGSSFAQDENDNNSKPKIKLDDNDEIIIKKKGDKTNKVTVEVNNGQVSINGKPVEFKDGHAYIDGKMIEDSDGYKIIIRENDFDGDVFEFAPPRSPYRGGTWSINSERAFLGVSTEKADAGGVSIEEVTKGSAAEKIGLKKGDIITKIDDTKIDDPQELTETIRKHKPEDKVVVTYKRDGKEQQTTAILGKQQTNFAYSFAMPKVRENIMVNPDIRGPFPRGFVWNDESPRLGIKAQDTEEGKGAKVLDVDDDSQAAKAGIKEGDIITQFDGKEVTSANQLAELARASKAKASVKVRLNRKGKIQDVIVKTPKKLKTAEL